LENLAEEQAELTSRFKNGPQECQRMTFADTFTPWTARAAFVLYVLAVVAMLRSRPCFRAWWSAAFLVMLVHVAAAFHFVHHWSHQAAYEDTARQTLELMGQSQGGGIFANYALLVIWGMDVVWLLISEAGYRSRSKIISWSIHVFLAFMWLNAAVVFAHGWFRWVGLAGFLIPAAVAWRQRKTASTGGRRKQFT
jgi:hypothetical protein